MYETVYILRPDLSEEGTKKIVDRMAELVAKRGGRLLEHKDLGIKSLAYRVARQTKGRYLELHFEGGGPVIEELERSLRLSEECLRFLTTRVVPPQARRSES